MATAVQEKQQTFSKSDFKYTPMLALTVKQEPDMTFHYYKEDGTLGIINNYRLIRSVEELREFALTCKDKIIAVDTETTGLTYMQDYIVGFSISLNANSGIYVPIRHQIRREEKVKEIVRDTDGNILYTKAGKPRQKTVSKYTYFPQPENLSARECLDILYEIMLNAKFSLLHNSEFDLNMLKYEGYDITKVKTFDTLILPYIYDAEGNKVAGLKECSKLLGRRQATFKETVGDEGNFQYTTPSESYVYACTDVADTFNIWNKMYPLVKKLLSGCKEVISLEDNGKPYDIIMRDNELIRAFVDYYGHVDIEVDKPVAEAYREKIFKDLEELSEKVYSYFGKGIFSLQTGSKEFKSVMEEFHVVTGLYTDKGAISFAKKGLVEFAKNLRNLKFIIESWDKVAYDMGHINKRADVVNYHLANILEIYGEPYIKVRKDRSMNSINLTTKTGSTLDKESFKQVCETMLEKETEKLEVLKNVQKIASLNKALNGYMEKLCNADHCRMRYKLQGTASGRLSSGNGSKTDKKRNHYYIDLNAQNLTKPNPAFYLAERCKDENDPENILGYRFTMVSDEYYHEHKDDEDKIIVEGAQPTANIRKCMRPGYQNHYYYKSIDENGTEEDTFFEVTINDEVLHITKDSFVNWKRYMKYFKFDSDEEKWLFVQLLVQALKQEIKSIGKHKYVIKEYEDNRDCTVYNECKKVSRLVLSLDYSSQEYLVLANISKDHVMLKNFYDGIDPHTATAYAIWGKENYDKFKRRKAKVCNFCVGYGGTAPTLAQQLEIPLEEANEIIKGYEKGYWECMQWKKQEINKMFRQKGACFTVFGRPRQFGSRINMANNFPDAKVSERLIRAVERRVPNHIIQGTCGDILRWDLIKLYRKYFKERDPHLDFLNTIHDEVNYSIDRRKEYIIKYARELQDLMKFDILNPKLPIATSIEVGTSYGQCFPFKWKDETRTELVPKRA